MNIKDFIKRWFKTFIETLLLLSTVIIISTVIVSLMALPGVVIAFIIHCNTFDTIKAGLLSFLIVNFTVIIIFKIKERKNDNKSQDDIDNE